MTFKKGEWSTTLEDDVTVLDSNPINNWPKKYNCVYTANGYKSYSIRTLTEDGKFYYNGEYEGTYSYDGDNTITFLWSDIEVSPAIGNYEHFKEFIATTAAGEDTYAVCDLIKE